VSINPEFGSMFDCFRKWRLNPRVLKKDAIDKMRRFFDHRLKLSLSMWSKAMKLNSLLGQSAIIPSIPKVAQELIEAFGQNVSMLEVGQKLKLDPALSGKVLRLANSARYARNRSVDSVEAAAVLIGDEALKTLIIASGVTSALKGGDNVKLLWGRSFIVAEALRTLAMKIDINKEAAFTLGILHNIGEILIASAKPEMYKFYLREVKFKETRKRLEMKTYGLLSADVGAELAEKWKFSSSQIQAISHQNDLDLTKPAKDWANLIYLVNIVFDQWSEQDNSLLDREDIHQVLEELSMTLEAFHELLDQAKVDSEPYMALI